ncbi:MAG: hypothetical protein ACREUA_10865 [Burkholderiales bacterium]
MLRCPFILEERHLPARDPQNRVVQWHVFRDPREADEYAGNIVLGPGQHIVGGKDSDSIGSLWWVGVEVDDLSHWGNVAAINKHAQ